MISEFNFLYEIVTLVSLFFFICVISSAKFFFLFPSRKQFKFSAKSEHLCYLTELTSW